MVQFAHKGLPRLNALFQIPVENHPGPKSDESDFKCAATPCGLTSCWETQNMDFVEPIRDRKKITQIKNLLEGSGRYRDLLLFVMGINSALRVSDLLTLRSGDFIAADGTIRTGKVIREEKRSKRNVVTINNSIRETLGTYLSAYPGIVQD